MVSTIGRKAQDRTMVVADYMRSRELAPVLGKIYRVLLQVLNTNKKFRGLPSRPMSFMDRPVRHLSPAARRGPWRNRRSARPVALAEDEVRAARRRVGRSANPPPRPAWLRRIGCVPANPELPSERSAVMRWEMPLAPTRGSRFAKAGTPTGGMSSCRPCARRVGVV
jgi:hypothetical protein